MRKTILCTFAHPDDESFGPGGTIAKLARDNDVYIICATRGDAGQGKKGAELGKVRSNELLKSSEILGVKKVFFLNFKDGDLSNNNYHKLAGSIKKYLLKLKPEIILTFDTNGVSGHIDHIVVSLASSYVFIHQKVATELWYYVMHETEQMYFEKIGMDYFVYVPPAYKTREIDKIIDVSEVWNVRLKAMQKHKSQKEDMDFISKMLNSLPKKEYFRILKRE